MIYISYTRASDKILWKTYTIFLKKQIKSILQYYKLKQSIFLVLTNSENMIELNKEYRNMPKDTNVIAMEMMDDPICLGEIILSFEKIFQEFLSKDLPYDIYDTFNHYLTFILTHGFLHLLGYDHQNDREEEEMNKEQNKLLDYLKLSNGLLGS